MSMYTRIYHGLNWLSKPGFVSLEEVSAAKWPRLYGRSSKLWNVLGISKCVAVSCGGVYPERGHRLDN